MFEQRSYEKELMDDFDLAGDELGQNLRELELVNKYLGGYDVTLSALEKLKLSKNKTYQLIDIGSGAGDMIAQMHKWSKKNDLDLRFLGIDANQYMVDYASKSCSDLDKVSFRKLNIFEAEASELKADILSMNLFCHHFTDGELRKILGIISKSEVETIIINDLHRHPLAYYSIMAITRLFNGSSLIKNDAPLSVKRAFKRNELEDLFVNTNFGNINIKWYWAFRWQIIATR